MLRATSKKQRRPYDQFLKLVCDIRLHDFWTPFYDLPEMLTEWRMKLRKLIGDNRKYKFMVTACHIIALSIRTFCDKTKRRLDILESEFLENRSVALETGVGVGMSIKHRFPALSAHATTSS